MIKKIIIRQLGIQPYKKILKKMRNFSYYRAIKKKIDEIWFVQHPKIFTYGRTENKKNIKIKNNNIPIIKTDRGGKITYHGIGQQIIYFMINLKNLKIKIKNFISILENIVIKTLKHFSIKSYSRNDYRGIYVKKKKYLLLE